MSLQSLKDVLWNKIEPLLPEKWPERTSAYLYYASAYQNYKHGNYSGSVNDLNIVVGSAKRFGDNQLLAEAYLLRSFAYLQLAHEDYSLDDIGELDEGHPYKNILRSWFVYVVHDSEKEDAVKALAKLLADLPADKLAEISGAGNGIQLLDAVDEIAAMYAGSIHEAVLAEDMEFTARTAKKLSEYILTMGENGFTSERFLPVTSSLRDELIASSNSLAFDAEFKEATAESAARQYRFAYDIISAVDVFFPNDPEVRRLKGFSARRLSAQVNGGEAEKLLSEAVSDLKSVVENSGGIEAASADKNKKDIVKEYALVLSEYAKYFIDNKRSHKKELIKELLKESEFIWLMLEKVYPEEVEFVLNRLWVIYRRGKLDKSHAYALGKDVAPSVYEKITASSTASSALKSEISRLYMWFILEEANMKIEELEESEGAQAAKEIFLGHDVGAILDNVRKYTKGERWGRDYLWGEEGYAQIMGDIMAGLGNKGEAFKWYRLALRHLDELWKTEHRKWMVTYYRGYVKRRMGFYKEAISLQNEALSLIPRTEGERVWKANRELWRSLNERTLRENPPLEEVYENVVKMAELSINNIEACRGRDVDPLKYLNEAVMPTFELISRHGLCGKIGEKYHARLSFLLSQATVINADLNSKELEARLEECRDLLIQ